MIRNVGKYVKHVKTVNGTVDMLIDIEESINEFEEKYPGVLKALAGIDEEITIEIREVCPICESHELFHEGRCTTCLDCGWSKCII